MYVLKDFNMCLCFLGLTFDIYDLYQYNCRGGFRGGGAPPKIGKNMIFWRKIVIFHMKYLKNFRAPPNLKSWIHPLIEHLGYIETYHTTSCSSNIFCLSNFM